MKMVLLVVDQRHQELVETFLHRSGVAGYTVVRDATGIGATGPRLASGAFPKSSALIFTALANDDVAALRRDLVADCAACGERLRMYAWDVEEYAEEETP